MSPPKFDFYQTETHLTLTILKRGLSLDQCKVAYNDGHLSVIANDEPIFTAQLAHGVDSESFQLTCTPSKVEVKMRKLIDERWEALEKKAESVSGHKHAVVNWDKLANEVEKEEEKEKPEGDAAVNKLFQKIYADADDDVKKAMMKSYSESGGTVLSTNWNEIKKKKTPVKPPDGMEYKKW